VVKINPSQFGDEHHQLRVITHLIKPGREARYKEWMRSIVPVAKTFEGHLEINILRSHPGVNLEYIIVLHFNHHKNLQEWLESKVRRE